MRVILAVAGGVQFVVGLGLLVLIFGSLPSMDGQVDQFGMIAMDPLISLFATIASTAILSGAIFIVGACLYRRGS